MGVLCLSLFCFAMFIVPSRFAITSLRKRELVAHFDVAIIVLCLHLVVRWVGL